MRLIDADRLSEIIYENVSASYEDSREAKEECLREIEAAPAIDAVPVVRCKDCKNWGYGVAFCGFEMRDDVPKCWNTYEPTSADDFCSYGERKDGADHASG